MKDIADFIKAIISAITGSIALYVLFILLSSLIEGISKYMPFHISLLFHTVYFVLLVASMLEDLFSTVSIPYAIGLIIYGLLFSDYTSIIIAIGGIILLLIRIIILK